MTDQGIPVDGDDGRLKHLVLAMAFGQGAQSMLASEAAIARAVEIVDEQLARVLANWTALSPAAITLVRIGGQAAAQRALSQQRAEIAPEDVDWAFSCVGPRCRC